MSARLRFAPSPNGRLHVGHAFSALLNDRVARDLGGTWLLRIEDIDPERSTEANVRGILEDLAWLGLAWPEPVRRQSGHLPAYAEAAGRLRRQGLLYPCICTRSAIAAAVARAEDGGIPVARDPDGTPLYPGTCRHRDRREADAWAASGEPCAWRIDMAAALRASGPLAWRRFAPGEPDAVVAARPERWGDSVIIRKGIGTSYHLSCVVDDHGQGITHVVRGRDLEAATDLHALLADRLGLVLPRCHHHALLAGADGLKLAKSRGSPSLAALREAGETPGAIRARLGFAPPP